MRTNIVINDILMKNAIKMSGLKSKRETVERGLQLLIKFSHQKNVKNFKGKLKWEGNLAESRKHS